MAAERFTVQSGDGVGISVQKSGSGPALLLIHGALLNCVLTWSAVLPKLAEKFTVCAMDRRGRAPSGDGKDYSLSREVDDIVSVVKSIAQPVIIVAHSYGALATLAALPQLPETVTKLILYEPPVIPSPGDRSGVLEKLDRALAANDREEIVTVFLRDQIGAPPEVLEGFKSSPVWPIVLQIASTLPRESRTVNSSPVSFEQMAQAKIPTVMLAGTETGGNMRQGVDRVCNAIPGCRLILLEGQGHTAMLQAPDLFVEKLLESVRSTDFSL